MARLLRARWRYRQCRSVQSIIGAIQNLWLCATICAYGPFGVTLRDVGYLASISNFAGFRMSDQTSVLETRRAQACPILTAAEISRLRHFGETRRYKPGEHLVKAGERAPGMVVILSGEVDAAQHSAMGEDEHILTHQPGSFSAELS